MPLFAFVCRDCEKTSEILIRSEETPVCPQCGSRHMEKQMSHFAPMRGAESTPAPMPACAGCSNAGGGCPYKG
jgi:putative FmdB family regulatory protein